MISLIWTAGLLAPVTVELPLKKTVLPSAKLSFSNNLALSVPPLPVEPIIKQRRSPSQKSPIQSRVATVTTLHSFTNDDADGAYPLAEVTKVGDFLYGTTYQGGTEDDGTVFRLDLNKPLTQRVDTLYSFNTNETDGTNPTARLTLGEPGIFYGTTYLGGSNDVGTIFRIIPSATPANRLRTIRNFTRTNGAFPFAGVSRNTAGTLYGTTVGGGSSGFGTVFELPSGGVIKVRHNFRNGTDGARPYGGVILGASNLYGTTNIGGTNALGTVFRLLSPAAALSPLYSFKRSDGFYSFGSLVRDSSNGNLYGTTCNGGASGKGTVFRLSPSRALTTLHSFNGSNGECPTAGVTLNEAGTILYGTAYKGGTSDKGTVFKLRIESKGFMTLAHFSGTGTDGANPEAGVTLDEAGKVLYGTTRLGGSDNYGTVYRLPI